VKEKQRQSVLAHQQKKEWDEGRGSEIYEKRRNKKRIKTKTGRKK